MAPGNNFRDVHRLNPGPPLHVLIVGFGEVVRRCYVPALRRLGADWKYVVIEPNPSARISAIRLLPNTTAVAALSDALATGTFDAALIATPPSSHFSTWAALLGFGIPIYIEKPFPLSSDLGAVASNMANSAKLMI